MIIAISLNLILPKSHPSRVRGLKSLDADAEPFRQSSHPSRVRGLKFPKAADASSKPGSHPSRVRGLK